jgi:hypothetical protein
MDPAFAISSTSVPVAAEAIKSCLLEGRQWDTSVRATIASKAPARPYCIGVSFPIPHDAPETSTTLPRYD